MSIMTEVRMEEFGATTFGIVAAFACNLYLAFSA
jgi:hypothetical protein